MQKQPWEVADLLDEICKNADPYIVSRLTFLRCFENVRQRHIPSPHMIMPDHERRWLQIVYWIPIEMAMKDVEGTPEEVVDWARTGLKEGQDISLARTPIGTPAIAITQTFKDPVVYDDYMHLCDQIRRRINDMEST